MMGWSRVGVLAYTYSTKPVVIANVAEPVGAGTLVVAGVKVRLPEKKF